ncbi:MAG: valine--tRNA ligase [Chloroflexi bacterium]|nr:valine--tRNA ligase [Chloroflexota bacterium]
MTQAAKESPRETDSEALNRPYDATAVEQRWYEVWEKKGYFAPNGDAGGEPFVISMPPPNLTGVLHYGHVVVMTFEDLMIRWRRMQGRPTLWLPGTDHAAIATNAVLLDNLAKEGRTREELGRQGFEDLFWDWLDKSGAAIRTQLRRAGASCDWSRERFTMDEGLTGAVNEAFIRLYEKGLIYKGSYLVNWDPQDRTAISDLEVLHEPVQGKLWYVRYPIVDGGHLVVATTRPETILGDTAIAVHPEDERYAGLVGKMAQVPALRRQIPVIADDAVDPAFGSGAVKVTPGHDPNDYQMGIRQNLEMINILNEDGTLNQNAGPFAGQDRFEARTNLVGWLEERDLVERIEDHEHSVGHAERSGTIVEPMLSEQWFVRTGGMARAAADAVRDGRIQFHPQRFADEFLRWVDNIHDWCISRQIWVGHRLPVWYCQDCGETIVDRNEPESCPDCEGVVERDPDFLETWLRSRLSPFSTLTWPDATPDFERFYPTTVMQTGYDIIFFWVARMVMLGMQLAGDVPFRHVHLSGIMRREDGSKVSKSDPRPGDDPVEVFDQYGADPLRYLVATGGSPGGDLKLVWQRLEAARNFANKLWNAGRFTVEAQAARNVDPAPPTAVDRWITGRLDQTISDTTRRLEAYNFGEAGRGIHDFIWNDFCDWFIEASKTRLHGDDPAAASRAAATLAEVLTTSLRLLHPYMPFVTEELWSHLRAAVPNLEPEHIIVAAWPECQGRASDQAVVEIDRLTEAVRAIRNARREAGVEPSRRIEAVVRPGAGTAVLESETDFLTRLARIDPLVLLDEEESPPEKSISLIAGGMEIYLPLEGMIDLEAERDRLKREIERLEAEIARSDDLLSNEKFVERAPAQVVQKRRDARAAAVAELDTTRERLDAL